MSPLIDVANATKSVPLLFAFLLGIVGTLAPCQLTGNISAITLYGNQSLQKGHTWKHILLFILGKVIAFTTLGLLVWLLGKEIQQTLTLYFPWLRKLIRFNNNNRSNIIRYYKRQKFLLYPFPYQVYSKTK